MWATKRVLPQPVGPFSSTGRRFRQACSNSVALVAARDVGRKGGRRRSDGVKYGASCRILLVEAAAGRLAGRPFGCLFGRSAAPSSGGLPFAARHQIAHTNMKAEISDEHAGAEPDPVEHREPVLHLHVALPDARAADGPGRRPRRSVRRSSSSWRCT